MNLQNTSEEGKRQNTGRGGVRVRSEAKVDLNDVAVTETNDCVCGSTSETQRQTKNRQNGRRIFKVDGLGSRNSPRADKKLEGGVSHDVDTSRSLNVNGLQPKQVLNTDGTVVRDGTKCLRNGNGGGSSTGLTKVNHTGVIPVGSRTECDRTGSRVARDTNPHVTRVLKGTSRNHVDDTHNTGRQGVEREITGIVDGARDKRYRCCKAIVRGNIEPTLVVQASANGGENIVDNGEVDSRHDCKVTNREIDSRCINSVLRDCQCPCYGNIDCRNEPMAKIWQPHGVTEVWS